METKLIRVTQGLGVDYVKDNLVPPPGMEKDKWAEQLKTWLGGDKQAANHLYFLTVFSISDEKTVVEGFLIAVLPPDQSTAILFQLWGKHKEQLWNTFEAWADGMGATRVRHETTGLSPYGGFKQFSVTYQCEIGKDVDDGIPGLPIRGRETKDNVGIERQSGNDVERNHEPDAGERGRVGPVREADSVQGATYSSIPQLDNSGHRSAAQIILVT